MVAETGMFTHPITLYSTSGDTSETVEALVDTGATFTSIPGPILDRLEIRPERGVMLRFADGRVAERDMELVLAELDGVRGTVHCVFGDPDDPPVIGAMTLEAFLLGVDPAEKKLVPVVGLSLKGRTNA